MPLILTCTNFSQYISKKVFIKSALPENTCPRVDLIQAIQTTKVSVAFKTTITIEIHGHYYIVTAKMQKWNASLSQKVSFQWLLARWIKLWKR